LINDVSFTCATLLTINEIYTAKPGLKTYSRLSDENYDPVKRDPKFAGID